MNKLDRAYLGRFGRRSFIRGLGGVTLGLPFLEGLDSSSGRAHAAPMPGFAIFFRQANGVACAQSNDELGMEPERFWPNATGPLTSVTTAGTALTELQDHFGSLLVVRNVNMHDFDYADGHARGALQLLTAQGPVVPGVAGDSEANGESLDHRIGRELNPNGRDSLFLYAGEPDGWLGGPCLSYRSSNVRRSAINDPAAAYELILGGKLDTPQEKLDVDQERRRQINDVLRAELDDLSRLSRLSKSDQEKLQLHRESLHDIERRLSCRLALENEAQLEGLGDIYASTDGTLVLETARLHMDITAVAVSCGYTRSAVIQVGNGNDAATRYKNPVTGELMENYHFISHRRTSHDATGGIIAGSDLLHHYIDQQFAQTFLHLITRLKEREILDQGVAVWLNDLGNGPGHAPIHIPWVMAGSVSGTFKQGQCIDLEPGKDPWSTPTHARVLNAIGTAVGCRTEGKEQLEDFGDATIPRTPHPALFA